MSFTDPPKKYKPPEYHKKNKHKFSEITRFHMNEFMNKFRK